MALPKSQSYLASCFFGRKEEKSACSKSIKHLSELYVQDWVGAVDIHKNQFLIQSWTKRKQNEKQRTSDFLSNPSLTFQSSA